MFILLEITKLISVHGATYLTSLVFTNNGTRLMTKYTSWENMSNNVIISNIETSIKVEEEFDHGYQGISSIVPFYKRVLN